MRKGKLRIGIVAPSSRIKPELAEKITRYAKEQYGDAVALKIHPQCFLNDGHFAGSDEERARAFLEYANSDEFDAIWFARGGYGAARMAQIALPGLRESARQKIYLGYSDTAALLGALYARGCGLPLHGPMPSDFLRAGGEKAVKRAISFLLKGDDSALEANVTPDSVTAAFNMTILAHMMGTPSAPDLTGHVLMLEEVSEAMYRFDRTMLHLTSVPAIRRVAGIRLGRVSDVPENDPVFGENEEEITKHWCAVAGIPYLGRADIGHDIENKIVPFGRLRRD